MTGTTAAAAAPEPQIAITFPLADLGPATMEQQRFIPLELIHESPFNPRKDFDPAGIAELAESIKVNGLHQNLTVRPHPKRKEHFELMGGARRFRALKLLKAEGAICKIKEASDAESIALQLLENLQREDVAPMDEAAAFAELQKLDPVRYSALNISAAIGKSKRFVLQRLALVNNLSADLQDAMKEDGLKIETARTLAAVPQSLQKLVLDKNSYRLDHMSADDVREAIADHAVPASAAAFDVALYTGDYIEEGKKRYFGDVAQFDQLQKAVAKAKVEKLKEKWPGAKLVTEGALSNWQWGDNGKTVAWSRDHKPSGKISKAKCTAIVCIDGNHKILTFEGVKPDVRQTYTTAAAQRYEETPERKAEREGFNKGLIAAYAKNSGVAMRFLLLEMITGDGSLNIGPDILKRALPAITIHGGWMRDDEKAKFWPRFAELKDGAVMTALREIALAIVDDDYHESWSEHEKACPPLMLALGKSLGVAPAAAKPAAEPAKPAAAKKAAPKAKAKAKAKGKKKQ